MARGLSVHAGLNSVDPAANGGWNGELPGCENDAKDMAAIAAAKKYDPTIIFSEDATLKRIREELRKAAAALAPGDEFIFSYSGHGGQFPTQMARKRTAWTKHGLSSTYRQHQALQ